MITDNSWDDLESCHERVHEWWHDSKTFHHLTGVKITKEQSQYDNDHHELC